MRKFCYIFIFIIFLMHFKLCAQINLVPNGNFEIYSQCPAMASEINVVPPWTSPNTGTPDYLNSCSSTMNPTTSFFGPQLPRSGDGITGGVFYASPPSPANGREYVQIELTSPLTINKTYLVSFFISLADESKIATSRVGCYFSPAQLSASNMQNLNVVPQIENSFGNFITDKNNWVQISGFYHALGNETHLIIGNFHDDASTDILNLTGSIDGAYYYIDDISVLDSSAIGINEINNKANITIYPNPSNGNLQIDLSKLNENGDLQFVIYNTLGIEIKKQQITANEITNVDLSDLANGTYFYKVFKDGKLYKYDKLVLIK